MLGFLARYRAFLAAKALPLKGLGWANELKYQLTPWMIVPLFTAASCWALSASDVVWLWSMRAAICIMTVGCGLVIWEFLILPIYDEFKCSREQQER